MKGGEKRSLVKTQPVCSSNWRILETPGLWATHQGKGAVSKSLEPIRQAVCATDSRVGKVGTAISESQKLDIELFTLLDLSSAVICS